jgi:hypothetical protein
MLGPLLGDHLRQLAGQEQQLGQQLARARRRQRAGAPAEVDRQEHIDVSWVVNALVEATPISGPAWV